MAIDATDEFGIGHNKPPAISLDHLATDFQGFVDSIEAVAKEAGEMPKRVESDEDDQKVSTVVAAARVIAKKVEAARVMEKEPYLAAERGVDGFFKPLQQRLDRIMVVLSERVTAYKRAKDERERQARRAAEIEARRAAEEARLAAEQAAAAGRTDDAMAELTDAIKSEGEADDHKQAAGAKSADLTRTRAEGGTMSTLRGRWTFELLDYDVLPLEQLRPFFDQKAIESALQKMATVQKDRAKLEGVRFFEEKKALIR